MRYSRVYRIEPSVIFELVRVTRCFNELERVEPSGRCFVDQGSGQGPIARQKGTAHGKRKIAHQINSTIQMATHSRSHDCEVLARSSLSRRGHQPRLQLRIISPLILYPLNKTPNFFFMGTKHQTVLLDWSMGWGPNNHAIVASRDLVGSIFSPGM